MMAKKIGDWKLSSIPHTHLKAWVKYAGVFQAQVRDWDQTERCRLVLSRLDSAALPFECDLRDNLESSLKMADDLLRLFLEGEAEPE